MLVLSTMPSLFAIVYLDPSSQVPSWACERSDFFSITKTVDELSIVCSEVLVPRDVKAEKGWKGLKVEGPLDFSLTGILASLSLPLAEAKISIFAVSTFQTDYLLVKQENFQRATEILSTFCKIITTNAA